MRIAIRLDDIGLQPFAGTDAGLQLARACHDAMQGSPYLGAVIPASLDDEGRGWLKSRPQGMTVAMHGVTHKMVAERIESEFAGRERRECATMIELGMLMLGVPVDHFVAPYNHYGANLDEALADNGIRYHWTGPTIENDPSPVVHMGRYVAVPAWKPLYGALLWPPGPGRPLCESIPMIMERPGMAVLTLHATWEASQGKEFKGIRWLIERYADRIISPEIYTQ